MEVAALVLGIVSLATSLGLGLANMGWLGSICAIVGIVLGAIGLKRNGAKKGYAKVGLILSIVALSWGIVATIACIACFSVAGGIFTSIVH